VETKWIILIYFFFKFNWIFYCKQPHFTSRNSVTLFSLATTDIGLVWLRHSTYPSALVSACQMMNWPNKFLIWSSTSTLALSIGALQRNAAQITVKNVYYGVLIYTEYLVITKFFHIQITYTYITDLVCYTYLHWFFNPECQHILRI
jgi:hypothetical protein